MIGKKKIYYSINYFTKCWNKNSPNIKDLSFKLNKNEIQEYILLMTELDALILNLNYNFWDRFRAKIEAERKQNEND